MKWNKTRQKLDIFTKDIPIPKSGEYKTMQSLLDLAEVFKNRGNKKLEKEIWKLISEEAISYSL